MNIGAIVQARMSSQRLPNKVLCKVAGKPLLEYLLERLRHCNCLDTIVVATSVDDSDAPIAEYCRQQSVLCYRGPLANVADRFNQVLDMYQFDVFVRVTGDSPLLDQRLVDKGVGIFLKGDFDLVTNGLPCTYPKGQSVEVLRTTTYQRAYGLMQEAEDLEHVTMFFYKHQDDFRIQNFALDKNLNDIRLCVDTWQDIDNYATIVSKMTRPHWEYALDDILQIYQELINHSK
jgi:spore coat polysaccharide biosynthesis protein SpsF